MLILFAVFRRAWKKW